jgi:hypothetical protein
MRIRDPGWKKFGSGILDEKKSDPGSGMEKIRIRDRKNTDPEWKNSDPGSGMKKNSDPGSGMEKIRIRDVKNPDPG